MLRTQICLGHNFDGSLVLSPLQVAYAHLSEGTLVDLVACFVLILKLLTLLVEIEFVEIYTQLVDPPQIIGGGRIRVLNTVLFTVAQVPHIFSIDFYKLMVKFSILFYKLNNSPKFDMKNK